MEFLPDEREPELFPVGTEGNKRASISSSSSIEGKACWKPAKSKWFNRGEDEAEDVGEGGPKLEAGMRVCGEGFVEFVAVGGDDRLDGPGGCEGAVGS